MDHQLRVICTILILLLLIGLAMWLKRIGLLDEDHGRVFSRLVTKVTLPALILFSMARAHVVLTEVELALAMLAGSLACLALAWWIARLLALPRARAGPFILAAGFANTSLLGIALVREAFPGDAQALAEAVVIAAVGVQPLLFTLGTMIAIYYGDASAVTGSRLAHTMRFFHSPIFLAFVGGLLLSLLVSPGTHPAYEAIMDGVHIAGAANTFLVTLAIGLFISLRGLKDALLAITLAAMVKLLVMPLLIWLPARAIDSPGWQLEVAVLEASMPSAMLGVVLAGAYGCDARFACRLVLATTVLSVITVPVMFRMLT